jgi:hypothetical protein
LHETTELKPPGSKTEADAVLRQLKGPAIGLVVTGIANWLTLPLLIAIALYLTSSSSTTGTPFGIMEGIVALAILVLSTLMILGGLKIMRCEGRGLGILGALLAMIVTPGNLIGLPLGIWALVVLNNREVKEAFQQNSPVWRATKFTTWAALLAVLAISAFVGVAAAVHLGSGHNPKGEIEYVVQPKEGHLTFAFDDITLVFEGIQTDERSSRSCGWMPVRGGSKITIEMSGRSYSGKAESGPPGINMVTINGYTFQLAKNCTQLWPPFPKGSAPLYLDQIDGPVTIWIAEDGTHRLERRPSTTTTSNNGEAASTRK